MNFEKNVRFSSHSDLRIELVHVVIGALRGLKLRFCDIFARLVAFFALEKLFLEKEIEENPQKNSRCSSHSDLSIESLHVAIRALTGLKLRFL